MKNILFKTNEGIADFFGTSPEMVKNQFIKNRKDLKTMLNKSLTTGKKVNGFTSEQLREMIDKIELKLK